MENFHLKIADKSVRAAVIGLGYVGLPLAVEIAKNGFNIWGFDISEAKINTLVQGQTYIKDIDEPSFYNLVKSGKFKATTDFSHLKDCDLISICVPTPLGKGKDPDVSYILQAVNEIKKYLRPGQTIILESTTYPGTTNELVLTLLEETGLKVGKDFYLAFSPERIDPGNKKFGIKNTPKIIGGATHNCTEIACSFYKTFIDKVIPVSSTQVAEMVKLLENTFRAVNIGLANEIAIICNRLGINTWEVIEAAATKPFGFMPFYPGPGLGGHCIPVDPHYLVWKLRSMDYNPKFIQLADEINSSMPRVVVEKITSALNSRKKSVMSSKVMILGVAYKSNIDDYRESPALDVIKLLKEKGAEVSYYDPYIPSIKFDGFFLESVSQIVNLNIYDCVAILTHHDQFLVKKILEECNLLVDARNATKDILGFSEKIFRI